MSMREEFEKWAKEYYQEQKMSRNSNEHFSHPNCYMLPNYEAAWEGYQAATEAAQAKLASQQLRIEQVEKALCAVRDRFFHPQQHPASRDFMWDMVNEALSTPTTSEHLKESDN